MSASIVRKALEARAEASAGGLSLAFQNRAYTPVVGSPWGEVSIMWANPDNPTLGDGFNREPGVLQINLHYPPNEGSAPIEAKAEAFRAAFPRGLVISSGGVVIRVLGKPSLSPSRSSGGWHTLSVSVQFQADIWS